MSCLFSVRSLFQQRVRRGKTGGPKIVSMPNICSKLFGFLGCIPTYTIYNISFIVLLRFFDAVSFSIYVRLAQPTFVKMHTDVILIYICEKYLVDKNDEVIYELRICKNVGICALLTCSRFTRDCSFKLIPICE